MDFPVFRRYTNRQSYFRIDSPVVLHEIKLIGKFYQEFRLDAVQLPDRNFVSDLVHLAVEGAEALSQPEYDLHVDEIRRSHTLMV
ncbi:MAG: hypothetical protein V4616_03095 [Bacteroidota bacterium]